MRYRYLLPLLAVSFAAWAFTPEELLTERQVPVKCEGGVCTVAERDLEWLVGRDRLLSDMVQRLYGMLQSCKGARDI